MAEQTAGRAKEKDKKDALVTEITPQSEDFSRWYLDVVPTTRRSRAAWRSGRTAMRSGS